MWRSGSAGDIKNKIRKSLILTLSKKQKKSQKFKTRNKKPKTMIYEQTEWAKNQAKWSAAEQYAKSKGYQFVILTEKHINN